jgi:hypothetical protein
MKIKAVPSWEGRMALLATYKFALKGGEIIRGATLYTKIEPKECQPEFPGSDIRCDLERVNVVITSNPRFVPNIFWSDEIFGTKGDARLLCQGDDMPRDIALIEIPGCQTWIMRSEPTADERIGITIANTKGRVLFTGIGDITAVEFIPLKAHLRPKQGHVFTFSFNAVYPWKMANPMDCAHASGADRQPSPAIYPDYSAPDGGAP